MSLDYINCNGKDDQVFHHFLSHHLFPFAYLNVTVHYNIVLHFLPVFHVGYFYHTSVSVIAVMTHVNGKGIIISLGAFNDKISITTYFYGNFQSSREKSSL